LVVDLTTKGNMRVLLAHRPVYDDWSFPKGKAEAGETPESAAIREVLEETGYRCRIIAPLGLTRHNLDGGVKEVTWYAMRPLPDSPGFEPNAEVDQISWLSPRRARDMLAYENEQELIDATDLKRIMRTGTLRLVRHGDAGERGKWPGADITRPLTAKGRRQAGDIAEALAGVGVDRILSSPYLRCVETVEAFAAQIGAHVELEERLADETTAEDALSLLASMVGYNAILCSHGDLIPLVLRRLRRDGLAIATPIECAKGSIWEIEVDGGKFTEARYRPPPG
jgi:8-oxo-dGTP diphosphatase